MVEQQMLDTIKSTLEKLNVPAELIQKIQDTVSKSEGKEDASEGAPMEKCPKCGYDMSQEKPQTSVEVTVEKKAPSKLQGMLDMLNRK